MDHSKRSDIILIDIMCNYIRKNHKGLLQKHSPGRHPKKMLLKMYQQLMLPVVELNKLEVCVSNNRAISRMKSEPEVDELNGHFDEETDTSRIRNGRIFVELSSTQNRKDSSHPFVKKHQPGGSTRIIKAQQNRIRDKKQTKYNGHRVCNTIYKFLKHHRYLQSKLLSTYKIAKAKQLSFNLKANGESVRNSTAAADDNRPCLFGNQRENNQKINGTSKRLIKPESGTTVEENGALSTSVDEDNTGCHGAGDTRIVPEIKRKTNAAFETKPTSNEEGGMLKTNLLASKRSFANHVPSKSPESGPLESDISVVSPQNDGSLLSRKEPRQEATRSEAKSEAFELAPNTISCSTTANSSSASAETGADSYDMQVSGIRKREPEKIVSEDGTDHDVVVLDVLGGILDCVVNEESLQKNSRLSCNDSRYDAAADLFKESDLYNAVSLEHQFAERCVESAAMINADLPSSTDANGNNNGKKFNQSANKKSNYCCIVTYHVRQLMNDILTAICASDSPPGFVNDKTLATSKYDLLCKTLTQDNKVNKGNNDTDTISRHHSDGGCLNGQDTSKLVTNNDCRSAESSLKAEAAISCVVKYNKDKKCLTADTNNDMSFERITNKGLGASETTKIAFKEDGQEHLLGDQHNGTLNNQLNIVADPAPVNKCEAESELTRLLSDKNNTTTKSFVLSDRILHDREKQESWPENEKSEQNSVARKKDSGDEQWENSSNDNFQIDLSYDGETELDDTLPDIPPVTGDFCHECVLKEKPKVRRKRKKLKFSKRKTRTQDGAESNGQLKKRKSESPAVKRALSANQKRQQARKRKIVQERRKLYPRRESIFYASDFLFKSENEESVRKRLRDNTPVKDTKSGSVVDEVPSTKRRYRKKSEKQNTESSSDSFPNSGLGDSDGRLSVEFSKYNWFLEKYKIKLKDKENGDELTEVVKKPVKTKYGKKSVRKQIKLNIKNSDKLENDDCESCLVNEGEENKKDISNKSENKPTGSDPDLQILKVISMSSSQADASPPVNGGDTTDVKDLTGDNNTDEGQLGAERRDNVRDQQDIMATEPVLSTGHNDDDKPLDLSIKSATALPLDLSLSTKKYASDADRQRKDVPSSQGAIPSSSYACFNLPIPKSLVNTIVETTPRIPRAHDHPTSPSKAPAHVHSPALLGNVVNPRYQSTLPVTSVAHVLPSSLPVNTTTHTCPSALPANVTVHDPQPTLSVTPSKYIHPSTLPVHQTTHMRSPSLTVNPATLPPPPLLRSSPALANTAVNGSSIFPVCIDNSKSDLVIRPQRAETDSAVQLPGQQQQRSSPNQQAPVACLDGFGQRPPMPYLMQSKTVHYRPFNDKQLSMSVVERSINVYNGQPDTERRTNLPSNATYTDTSSGSGSTVEPFARSTSYTQNRSGPPPYQYTSTSRYQDCSGQAGFSQVPVVPYGGSVAPSSRSAGWRPTTELNRRKDQPHHRHQRSPQHQLPSYSSLYSGQQEARFVDQIASPVQTARKGNCYGASAIYCQVCCNKATFLCSGCRKVAYCSRRCQSVAWKYHRTSCAV